MKKRTKHAGFAFKAGLFYTLLMEKYVMFDHTADLGIEIFGRTKKELFTHAAWALTDIMMGRQDVKKVKGRKRHITVEGADLADLLINYLREILYLLNGEHLVIQTCGIQECGKRRLVAQLEMEPYHHKQHTLKTELKAVTYHGLSVEKTKSGWKARIIFDV